jgi:hypothetical protein
VVHREPSNRPEVVGEFAREVNQFLRDGEVDPAAFLRELARLNPAVGRALPRAPRPSTTRPNAVRRRSRA